MSLIGQIGTKDSYLGNIEPGIAGGGIDNNGSNSLTFVGTATAKNVFNRSIVSTLTFIENIFKGSALNLYESLTFVGTVDYFIILTRSPNNALSLVGQLDRNIVSNQDVPQTLTFVGTANKSSVFNRSVTNTLTFTQDSFRGYLKSPSSTLTFTQQVDSSVIHSPVASNTLTLIGTVSRNIISDSVASNTLTLTQNINLILVKPASNTLTLTQSATVLHQVTKVAANTLTISQDLSYLHSHNQLIVQGLNFTQTLTRSINYVREVDQTINWLTTALGIDTRIISNSLTFSQTTTYLLVKAVKQSLEFGQSVSVNIVANRHLFTIVPLFHTLTRQYIHNQGVVQPLNFVQTAIGLDVRATLNNLNLTQNVVFYNAKAAKSVIVFNSTVSQRSIRNKTLNANLVLKQSVISTKIKKISTFNVLAFNQFTKGHKIYYENVSNTLTLSQELVKTRTIETTNNVLNLTQTAICKKIMSKSIAQSILFNSMLARSGIIERSIHHTLHFATGYYTKSVNLGGITTITIPIANATIVKKSKTITVLQVPGQAIVLPSSKFNNTVGTNDTILVKRTMTGGTLTYKKTANGLRRVKYLFELGTAKKEELITFLSNYDTQLIQITDWAGEIWYAYLTNDPLDFLTASRYDPDDEKTQITLEFEGVRVA